MPPVQWQDEGKVPPCVAAALSALCFDGVPVKWPDASPQEWEQATYYLHRNQMTLLLRAVCGRSLPPGLGARLDEFQRANSARLSLLRITTSEVLAELKRAGIEAVVLKGFARAAEYVPDVEARMHYDIDLYCPQKAQEAAMLLRVIGYEPLAGTESDGAGHLAPLARPTHWQWRGDFFDLETPVHVEIHERLWVPEVELFSFSSLGKFWARRENDGDYCTLSRHDTLAYRSMHLLRHLLRGDVRAAGIYEIAYFLHQNRADSRFWAAWQTLFPADLRVGQAVCFALARRWFGCDMHSIPLTAVESLPEPCLKWMTRSAASPAESFFAPGKEELALHFALVDSAASKYRIALRRLLPLRHTPRMWEGRAAYFGRLRSRAIYHARAFVPALWRLLIIRR